jgi:uncharacterized HhH-GPD family protein
MMPELTLAFDPDADTLLSENSFALLIGMLLDQQIPMERAFLAPYRLAERVNGPLTPDTIVSYDLDELTELFRASPALHRFPKAMAERVRLLADALIAEYDGDTEQLWVGAPDGLTVRQRLEDLPGFGRQKAQIFLALLAKQCGVTPPGWQDAAGSYGDTQFRSIADVTDQASLEQVRAFKQAAKQAAKR